jgi:hypothetical protein
MKSLFLTICSAIFCFQLTAEEKDLSETYTLFFELGEITAPLSFYTESWDPKQELPPILPEGQCFEEQDLIISIDKSPRTSKDRSEGIYENNWNAGG